MLLNCKEQGPKYRLFRSRKNKIEARIPWHVEIASLERRPRRTGNNIYSRQTSTGAENKKTGMVC